MSTWADYGISKVSYNKEHTHIVEVIRRKDLGDKMGAEERRARKDVVDDLKAGITYVTITLNASGQWQKGDKVDIVKIQGVEYIRTDGNQKASDNLGELPEYQS